MACTLRSFLALNEFLGDEVRPAPHSANGSAENVRGIRELMLSGNVIEVRGHVHVDAEQQHEQRLARRRSQAAHDRAASRGARCRRS